MPSRAEVRERLQTVVHVLTIVTILLKAFSKLEHPEGYWPVIIFLFASAAAIATLMVLHHRSRVEHVVVEASTYAIESAVTATMAWLFFKEGKNALPWVMVLAAVGFAIACVTRLVKRNAHHANA